MGVSEWKAATVHALLVMLLHYRLSDNSSKHLTESINAARVATFYNVTFDALYGTNGAVHV